MLELVAGGCGGCPGRTWEDLILGRKKSPMCDFSLQSVRSRPAKVGDKLVTRDFGTGTRGFADADDLGVAVCLLPGTELAFAGEVACLPAGLLGWKTKTIRPPDGHLPPGQQGEVGRASRRARVSGWAHRVADAAVRGPGGNACCSCRRNPRPRPRRANRNGSDSSASRGAQFRPAAAAGDRPATRPGRRWAAGVVLLLLPRGGRLSSPSMR